MKTTLATALLLVIAATGGCIEHRIKTDPVEIKPIKVEPIQITVDVNVRVDRELDRFFAYEEDANKPQPPTPQPSPQ